jgi:tRNA (cytidine/uridine-2'-O-)-methyltransferase
LRRLLAPLPAKRKGAGDAVAHAAQADRPAPVRDLSPQPPTPVMIRIALFEPDIPQNTGTILRLAACFGIEAHLIEPAGFPVSDRAFRRAGMDYLDQVALVRHPAWDSFAQWRKAQRLRLALLTTRAAVSFLDHPFSPDDILLFGRESAGVPDAVHACADARLRIPMRPGLRSLNVAVACAMVVGEALRQTRSFPPVPD